MDNGSEDARKKIELLDKRIHEKATCILAFVISMNENLNYLEKNGMLSRKIIARQRKQISKIKKTVMETMMEGESRDLFQIKYR